MRRRPPCRLDPCVTTQPFAEEVSPRGGRKNVAHLVHEPLILHTGDGPSSEYLTFSSA
jgi:hypothetical protein